MMKPGRSNINLFVLTWMLSVHITTTEANSKKIIRYPQNALKCYATLSPNEKIICPEGRHNFCVKEVVNASRRECGKTLEYRNDIWDKKEPGGACLYRKCASSCKNTTSMYVGNKGELVQRTSYCCSSNLCNNASRFGLLYVMLTIFSLSFIIR